MNSKILISALSVLLFISSMFRIPKTSTETNNIPISVPKYEKLIYLVIDGLRFDAVVPVNKTGHYYNKLKFFDNPEILKTTFFSIAGIPTCTTCRIISMMTGAPSNQIEELMTYFISSIRIEALPDKFPGKTIFHYGDSVWKDSFKILKNHSHYFCGLSKSLLVENEIEVIEKALNDNNDITFIHTIALDAFGHIYGTNHSVIEECLTRINEFIEKLYGKIDEKTLLVITSDHGVTNEGAHGSGSAHELASFVGFYSKNIITTYYSSSHAYNEEFMNKTYDISLANTEKDWVKAKETYKIVHQDDILPTVCYFMGVPVPINAYGNLIPYLIKDDKATKILVNQKLKIANENIKTKNINWIKESYRLTNIIYSKSISSNGYLAILSAFIGTFSLFHIYLKIKRKFYKTLKSSVVILAIIMTSHSYFSFASEDIIWLFLFLLYNLSIPNLLFIIYFLNLNDRSFFKEDKINLMINLFNKKLQSFFLIALFFIAKIINLKEISNPKSIPSRRYINYKFLKNLIYNIPSYIYLLYDQVFGMDQNQRIGILATQFSPENLVCIHLDTKIAFMYLYFFKNLDIRNEPITKFILLSFIPYLFNNEKVIQTIDFQVFFKLSDQFGGIGNLLGVFSYFFVPRLFIHSLFGEDDWFFCLNMLSILLCCICSFAMQNSLVFQYFFVGRFFFTVGFYFIDILLEYLKKSKGVMKFCI